MRNSINLPIESDDEYDDHDVIRKTRSASSIDSESCFSCSPNDDNYMIKSNICTILSRELDLPVVPYEKMGDYEIPKKYRIVI